MTLAINDVQKTIGQEGHRNWLYPQEAYGDFYKKRRILAWVLLLVYLGTPWLSSGGKPWFWLDLFGGKLVLFGKSFFPADAPLFAPLVISVGLLVFAVTSLWGRIWCGWACPQTVFLQFIFEPIERWVEGKAAQRKRLDESSWSFQKIYKKVLKHSLFLVFSALIANTFLAYIFSVPVVWQYMGRPPFEHLSVFLFMIANTLLFYWIFAWFKEQACIIVCPYAKFQSVLTDSQTLNIEYNKMRGEPRGKPSRNQFKQAQNSLHNKSFKLSETTAEEGREPLSPGVVRNDQNSDLPEKKSSELLGDCVDCGYCVRTCPTGIDIRQGMQLECIGCAKCIDACNSVMKAWKRSPNLIGYATQEGKNFRQTWNRPRVLVYLILVCVLTLLFTVLLTRQKQSSIFLARKGSVPFVQLGADSIINIYSLDIRNKSGKTRSFHVNFASGLPGHTNWNPNGYEVEAGQIQSFPLTWVLPRSVFTQGKFLGEIEISDGHESHFLKVTALGPVKP